jgi:hypothetical protein
VLFLLTVKAPKKTAAAASAALPMHQQSRSRDGNDATSR